MEIKPVCLSVQLTASISNAGPTILSLFSSNKCKSQESFSAFSSTSLQCHRRTNNATHSCYPLIPQNGVRNPKVCS